MIEIRPNISSGDWGSWGGCSSPLHTIKGVWGAVSSPAGSGEQPWQLKDFPVFWGLQATYSVSLRPVYSCRSPLIWHQGRGLRQPPWGPVITTSTSLTSLSTSTQGRVQNVPRVFFTTTKVYKTPAVGGFQFPTFHYLIRENVIGDFGRGGPLVFGILRPAANCPNFRTGNVLVVPNVGNNWHPACWKMHRFHEYEFFNFLKTVMRPFAILLDTCSCLSQTSWHWSQSRPAIFLNLMQIHWQFLTILADRQAHRKTNWQSSENALSCASQTGA